MNDPLISRTISILPDQITAVIHKYLPGRSVKSVTDRSIWIRHSFRIELDNDETVWLKADDGPEAEGCSEKEAFICNLLNTNGLPAPRVLALDASCELFPAPFIIQEHIGGRPLNRILQEVSTHEALTLFVELGAFFSKLHSIHNDRSGWIYGSGAILPYHPNDFMHRSVFIEKAPRLIQEGLISEQTYNRMVSVSLSLLTDIKQHQPSLVASTLYWTIYLEQVGDRWVVTKLTDLHDALYWDPAENIAGFKYPPFGAENEQYWQAFLSGYGGCQPDEKRLAYYRLISIVDGALGNYMAPPGVDDSQWKRNAAAMLPVLIDELENLGRHK